MTKRKVHFPACETALLNIIWYMLSLSTLHS